MKRAAFGVAACLLLLAATIASAQSEVTLTTLPQTQRQGTFQTASWVVPADATGYIRATANIAAGDYENPALSLWVRIYQLQGGVWLHIGGGRWTGGRYVDDLGNLNPMPYVQLVAVQVAGATLRAEIDIPVRMRVGVTAAFRDTPE